MLLLDSEGNRILAKYFQPPAALHEATVASGASLPSTLTPMAAKNPYQTMKQQRTLEQGVWDKARRASGTCTCHA